jgi:hypothetical protein
VGRQKRSIAQNQQPRPRALFDNPRERVKQGRRVLLPLHPPDKNDQPLFGAQTETAPDLRASGIAASGWQAHTVRNVMQPAVFDPVAAQIVHHLRARSDEGTGGVTYLLRGEATVEKPLLFKAEKVEIRTRGAQLDDRWYADAPRRPDADPGVELGVVAVDQVDPVAVILDPTAHLPHPC